MPGPAGTSMAERQVLVTRDPADRESEPGSRSNRQLGRRETRPEADQIGSMVVLNQATRALRVARRSLSTEAD
jgi:hypothetical protein